MDQGHGIKSPLSHRSDVVEKRMEMVAMLLNRVNEEANLGQAINQDYDDRGNHDKQHQIGDWIKRCIRGFSKVPDSDK